MSRSFAREVALKSIFQINFRDEEDMQLCLDYVDQFNLEKNDLQYAKDTVLGIINERDQLDEMINSYLIKWNVKRLNLVELAILRLATFEIIHRRDIPVPVAIKEAIEFTVKYSDRESVKYVNAVLEKIANNRRNAE